MPEKLLVRIVVRSVGGVGKAGQVNLSTISFDNAQHYFPSITWFFTLHRDSTHFWSLLAQLRRFQSLESFWNTFRSFPQESSRRVYSSLIDSRSSVGDLDFFASRKQFPRIKYESHRKFLAIRVQNKVTGVRNPCVS